MKGFHLLVDARILFQARFILEVRKSGFTSGSDPVFFFLLDLEPILLGTGNSACGEGQGVCGKGC